MDSELTATAMEARHTTDVSKPSLISLSGRLKGSY
jgi:hypothetical protein